MKIIKINRKSPQGSEIKQITNALKSGKVVILPTDTSYGLCADAFNTQAIEKIFNIKQRSRHKPISVFMRDIKMIKEITWVQPKEEKFLRRYLPGSFTFVLNRKEILPGLLNLEKDTIGIRIPSSIMIKNIMREIDFPITATSANISGEGSLYSVKQLIEKFDQQTVKPDLIVDAGKLPRVKSSTIVDLTSNPPQILREGPVAFKL